MKIRLVQNFHNISGLVEKSVRNKGEVMKSRVKRVLAGFVLWGLLSIIGSGALAGVVTLPPQLQPGDQYRLVFVTNGTRNASSQDIEVYNTFVQNQALLSAELAGLGINWHVIGSTLSVNAKDNTGTFAGVPIYNLNAQLVASGDLDLWDGALGNPINIDIYGNVLDGRVFTGTGTDGTGIENRQLGGPNSFQVQYGYCANTGGSWINSGDWLGAGEGTALYYYGISDVLTVAAVPAPGSFILLFSALAVFIGCKCRRCC